MARVKKSVMPEVVLQARNERIAELIAQCAAGEITFGDLQREVAAMGYRTTSLYEMVMAAKGR